jgi:hypothetical protein
MPRQDTKPRVGKRQADLTTKLETERRGPAEDLAESVAEKAKSGDADAHAVAKAVIDLNGSGD